MDMTDSVKSRPKVVVHKIEGDLKDSIIDSISHFGGPSKVFPREKPVWIKPNAVHYGKELHTGVEFLEAIFSILRDLGIKNIHLADNCTGGNLTRLVYHITGYFDLCKKYDVEAVLLDEEPTVPVTLGDEGRPVRFVKRLYDAWVREREGNVYLSAPKFKMHSMTTMTLAVKGQQGLLQDNDKMSFHNYRLHRRLADIYRLVRPDFTLVDARKIVFNGHFPATNMLDRCTEDMGLVIAGQDGLAVDVVGAKIMGYDVDEIEHLRLVKEDGLGEGDINNIDIVGDISSYTRKYPDTIMGQFPESFTRIVGREMACIEGCRGNSEAGVEYIHNEFGGKGGFNLVVGKGFIDSDFDGLEGDFLIVGPCAVLEAEEIIRGKYPDARVFVVPEHNDLSRMTGLTARLMKADPRKMSPVPITTAAWLLFQSWRKGSKSKLAKPF